MEVSDNNNIIPRQKERTVKDLHRLVQSLEETIAKGPKALDEITNIYKAVTEAIKGCHSSAYGRHSIIYTKICRTVTADEPVEEKNYVLSDEIIGVRSQDLHELFFHRPGIP